MLQIIFIIICGWRIYKAAQETNRNPILWTLAAVGVYIGTQVLTLFLIGILLAFGMANWGWTARTLEDYSIIVTILTVLIGICSVLPIFYHLNKVPDDETYIAPPPPPNFG